MQVANPLDLGQVHVHEKMVRSFKLVNTGSIPVEYEWDLGEEEHIAMNPVRGQVSVGDKQALELCYHPTSTEALKGCRIVCKICSGKSYLINLSAKSHRPNLHLSWTTASYGRVYTHADEAEPLLKAITLRNHDTQVCNA
jgi:hypothetical protein